MPPLKSKSLPVLAGSRDAAPKSELTPTWRSLSEFALGRPRSPEFAEGADSPPQAGGTSRRDLLQLLGASVAFAGLSGCFKPPDDKILPYTKQPAEIVPGNPLHYATATMLGGYATGLLVTSNEGRPTKIEGNPEHSASLGASGIHEQAALLQLYDPQRAAVVQLRGKPRSFRDYLTVINARSVTLKARAGEGLRLLVPPSSSPLIAKLRERIFATYPKARIVSWTSLPLSVEGAQLAFGGAYETQLHLSRALVVASLDADLLASLPGNLRHIRGFADSRDPKGPMSRLYAVESSLSVTGMSADHRLRLKPSELERFALALLGRIGAQAGALSRFASLAQRFALPPEQARFANALAKDLLRGGSRSLVAVGPRQTALTQAVAHAINAGLASEAVSYTAPVLHDADAGSRALLSLVEEMRAGRVETLLITAHNPVYGAPGDLAFGDALLKIPFSAYHSSYADETAARAGWHLPAAHELEAWGDGRAPDGTVTFQQPLVSPLFGGVSEIEVLSSLLGEGDRGAYSQLRDFWRSQGTGDSAWESLVAQGLSAGTAAEQKTPLPRIDAILSAAGKVPAQPAQSMGYELNVVPDYKVLDGRFSNNAWLQELPDPVTKLTWENAALLSQDTARELGVASGDLVDLGLRGLPVRAPVLIVPGHADATITVALGYGRRGAEKTAENLGFDTAPLRHVNAGWFDTGLTVIPLGKNYPLALTQDHFSMEGRKLALSQTLEKAHSKEGQEELEGLRKKNDSVHTPVEYPGYRWAMAIDLGRCTGCSACTIACQAENNIPVVGKEGVGRSREMHWLRIDRYFTGNDLNNPGVINQPMLCQHCESAPCEYVCPVNATVHSEEGLNEMVYNRCVGTRYCSNNCPYKVRRFNFFNYTGSFTDTEKMVFNPEVTVRSRGVMEKCTFCVQRIERFRITSRVAETNRVAAGGVAAATEKAAEVITACQQACPAHAISFGSLNDPKAEVTAWNEDERHYYVLNELNTRPRIAYLARVTNPNPELA